MIVLLPVYRPDARLSDLVAALREAAPDAGIVVVDDGSGPSAAARLAALPATVLSETVHRGKGAALKAGLRHIADGPEPQTVVCADGDGQHAVPDILQVGRHVEVTGRIALGVRRFDSGAVPRRSRIGNALTSALFRLATGRTVGDTQTGLRGFPPDALAWLCSVPGDGFDWEMNVLLAAARSGRPFDQVGIATRYLDANAGSHFAPLGDSLRIYRPLLRQALQRRSLRTTA